MTGEEFLSIIILGDEFKDLKHKVRSLLNKVRDAIASDEEKNAVSSAIRFLQQKNDDKTMLYLQPVIYHDLNSESMSFEKISWKMNRSNSVVENLYKMGIIKLGMILFGWFDVHLLMRKQF